MSAPLWLVRRKAALVAMVRRTAGASPLRPEGYAGATAGRHAEGASSPTAIEGRSWKTAAILCLCVLAALTIYALTLPHINKDITNYYLPWIEQIDNEGAWQSLRGDFANYTPPYIYLLVLYRHAGGLIDKVITIKLIPITFVFISSYIVYKILKRTRPASITPVFAAAGLLLWPTVVVNAAYWGQTDVIYTTFLLASLYSFLIPRPAWGTVWFGVAFSIKAQALFFAPYVGFLFFSRVVTWRHLVLVPLVYLAAMGPALLAGRPFSDVLLVYHRQAGQYERLSNDAPNPYEFIQYFQAIGYDTGVVLGLAIAAAAALGLALAGRRSPRLNLVFQIWLATLSLALMPFLLPKMHDRYFFPADVFSYVLAWVSPGFWPVAIGFQCGSLLAYSSFLFDFKPGPYLGGIFIALSLVALIAATIRMGMAGGGQSDARGGAGPQRVRRL